MRVLLLTGGSEIVAVALFEELERAGIPLAVISLGVNSLLRGVGDFPYASLKWPPDKPELTAQALVGQLRAWGASADDPWYVFPTEDGGLRLLLEHRTEFLQICRFGHARNLQMGGLDKAELFAYLKDHGCSDVMPTTVSVQTVDDALKVVSTMGGDCIIKPSLKPYSMDLSKLGAKAVATRDFQTAANLEQALRTAWPTAVEWVVQRRLKTPVLGEPVVWVLRDLRGGVYGVSAVERWKYPKVGGSGCWVEIVDKVSGELLDKAERVLAAIDYFGVCEIPFLEDSEGKLRILELNPRPWLQVGLPGAAGYPMGVKLLRVLEGKTPRVVSVDPHTTWVNVERMIAAVFSGQQGGRMSAALLAIKTILAAKMVAIFGTKLPLVRLRWLARMFKRLWY